MSGDLPPDLSRLFDVIARAAAAGEACPSNDELATIIGKQSASSIPPRLAHLVRRGLIEISRGNCRRVVTIVATGRSTAGTITNPHWRDRDPGADAPARPATRSAPRQPGEPEEPAPRGELLAARIEADQARLRRDREQWLAIEQQRYCQPLRGRLLEEMPA